MSRAIDNYTDKEREVLALKGMLQTRRGETAPRTASERPAPNKAQPRKPDAATHSPLVQHSICCNSGLAKSQIAISYLPVIGKINSRHSQTPSIRERSQRFGQFVGVVEF